MNAAKEALSRAVNKAISQGSPVIVEMKEYAFDVKLFANIRVVASSESAARKMLEEHVSGAECNFGAWPNGDPILGEVFVDDDNPDLRVDNADAAENFIC